MKIKFSNGTTSKRGQLLALAVASFGIVACSPSEEKQELTATIERSDERRDMADQAIQEAIQAPEGAQFAAFKARLDCALGELTESNCVIAGLLPQKEGELDIQRLDDAVASLANLTEQECVSFGFVRDKFDQKFSRSDGQDEYFAWVDRWILTKTPRDVGIRATNAVKMVPRCRPPKDQPG